VSQPKGQTQQQELPFLWCPVFPTNQTNDKSSVSFRRIDEWLVYFMSRHERLSNIVHEMVDQLG
jgi:hypothetical protein